jgi:hypothetical protein
MRAATYAGTPQLYGSQPPLALVWDVSRAQSAFMPNVLTPSHGESPEARKVGETLGRMRQHSEAEVSQPLAAVGSDFESLISGIDAEPVQDGVTHPAEAAVDEFIRKHGSWSALSNLQALDGGRAASLLRLLGRSSKVEGIARLVAIAIGLASSSVEVRDAAAQAAELWEDPASVPLLLKHRESTPWLAAYIERVANMIAG